MRRWLLPLLLALAPGSVAAQETSATQIDWYGYLRLDMAHDSAVAAPGNFALYVKPHARGAATSTLTVTGRQSRLGAKIARGSMKGRLEFDFYGASPENKNSLQLRYAVLRLPLGDFELEAGQTSDLISPLVPRTVNYSVAWGAGNVGYRRPQVKLLRRTARTVVGLSLGRNISGDLDGDSVVDGEASSLPAVQGRAAVTLVAADSVVTLGVSGHYGRCNCPSKDVHYANHSVNVDATLVLSPVVTLLGEAYRGVNVGAYGGSIYNDDTVDGLHSRGGWINLQVTPGGSRWSGSLGAGIDDVDESDIAAATTARVRNGLLFGALFVHLSPEVTLGFEASHWRTRYTHVATGTARHPANLRLQWSLQGDF
jgi:hypothetical protein